MGVAMMVSRRQAAASRERILAEAGRLFRERGLACVGANALAEAAELSHGVLYSRFGSKEQLAAEALTEMLAHSADPAAAGRRPGDPRCPLPFRPTPRCSWGRMRHGRARRRVPRHGPALRAVLKAGLRGFADRLAGVIRRGRRRPPEGEALAVIATLVGNLVLARAVDDPALSNRLSPPAAHTSRWVAMCHDHRLLPVTVCTAARLNRVVTHRRTKTTGLENIA